MYVLYLPLRRVVVVTDPAVASQLLRRSVESTKVKELGELNHVCGWHAKVACESALYSWQGWLCGGYPMA